MKKMKQILAIVLILFLVGLYILTLVAAITDSSGTMQYFFVSVIATILIPVLLWVYSFIYRLIKKNHESDEDESQK